MKKSSILMCLLSCIKIGAHIEPYHVIFQGSILRVSSDGTGTLNEKPVRIICDQNIDDTSRHLGDFTRLIASAEKPTPSICHVCALD